MDYERILNVAKLKFQTKFPKIVNDLEECIAAGSTGGEIIVRVGKYLYDLKNMNKIAYLEIQEEIISYLNSCRANGILIP
ncbi:hypothetical protein [Flavobacterium psychrotrophum]|uniref:hypothetical protein n=1 Tax=Flavobacterium psychrotrophum TaxID=2294119 RepID=UPI000E31EF9E|nr:hypothetical protein [Flavobacterium psychrotrophum]